MLRSQRMCCPNRIMVETKLYLLQRWTYRKNLKLSSVADSDPQLLEYLLLLSPCLPRTACSLSLPQESGRFGYGVTSYCATAATIICSSSRSSRSRSSRTPPYIVRDSSHSAFVACCELVTSQSHVSYHSERVTHARLPFPL